MSPQGPVDVRHNNDGRSVPQIKAPPERKGTLPSRYKRSPIMKTMDNAIEVLRNYTPPLRAQVVLLLIGSNFFMTQAWYFHLLQKSWPMALAIVVSWLTAFMEYCLQVPANKFGHKSNGGPFSAPQLKVLQEAISLSIFGIFSTIVLGEKPLWIDLLGFTFIFVGVAISTHGKSSDDEDDLSNDADAIASPLISHPRYASDSDEIQLCDFQA